MLAQLDERLGERKAAALRPVALVVIFLALWAIIGHGFSRGLPLGIILLGLIYGSLYALVSIGLVLVYRGSRVINFAQAEFGVLAAVVAIELAVTYHVNYYLVMLVGIVGSILLGGIINGVIIRRFRRSSRLILTVATIGLAQLLSGLSQIIPLEFCNPAKNPNCLTAASNQSFNTPLHTQFTIGPVVFSGNDIVALGGALVVIAALAVFLRYSRYGVAIRASAENGDRASLLGIPVARLDAIVWCLAALLSALAVLFRVPVLGFTGFQTVSGGGDDILVRTLAAAVIGRMDNLPRTAVAAIAIGIFDSSVTWLYSNTTYVDALLLVVIVVALILQRGVYARVTESDNTTWRSVAEVRPIPRVLAALPSIRWSLRGGRLLLAAVALFIPFLVSTSDTFLFSLIVVYAIVGLSLLVLTGWTGQISLGQFGFAGLGGATTAVLYQTHGWNFLLAMVAGVLVGAIAALIIGLPALRISGPFLAVTTLAFGVSMWAYVLNPQYLPWFVTSQVTRPTIFGHDWLASDKGMYYFALIAFFLVLMSVRSLRRSRTGRALLAVRDNEAAAKAATLNVARTKLIGFLISGAIAGFAGAIYVIGVKSVNQGSFTPGVNIALFSMVVIGGLGSLPGVVLGAIYVWSTGYFLTGGWAIVASGGGILLLLMFLPEGLGGLIYVLRDLMLRRVAKAHHLEVPGLLSRVVQEDDEGAAAVISELAISGPAPMGTPPQEGAGHMALTGGMLPAPLVEAGEAQAEAQAGAAAGKGNGGVGRGRRTRASKGGTTR
jgi:branched-chain amino acid transport system permease protein